jgi:hypothetical protein
VSRHTLAQSPAAPGPGRAALRLLSESPADGPGRRSGSRQGPGAGLHAASHVAVLGPGPGRARAGRREVAYEKLQVRVSRQGWCRGSSCAGDSDEGIRVRVTEAAQGRLGAPNPVWPGRRPGPPARRAASLAVRWTGPELPRRRAGQPRPGVCCRVTPMEAALHCDRRQPKSTCTCCSFV